MPYPGGKSGSGVYQTIINQMPPHEVYIEAFFGGGAVMKYKRFARVANIAIDKDAAVLNHLNPRSVIGINGDAFEILEMIEDWFPAYLRQCAPEDVLIYCDPPYLMSTRSSQRPIYQYELEDADHVRLLKILLNLPYRVMISGYPSDLYDSMLSTWRRVSFYTVNRAGNLAQEVLWMNYPEPFELHDYRYLGRDFRERERIKRKKSRWVNRLAQMDVQERSALLQAIEEARYKFSRSEATLETAMLEHLQL